MNKIGFIKIGFNISDNLIQFIDQFYEYRN